ncbi:tetratricopeptide repeat protein [Paractinoplanes rishiriensis]|uniref:tetratricopeptide repeat protein n=1 Tax=Paractinoplanes rishiriensis TaxID=1050105 RepID=UPI0019434940|nr:sel1 repeat family protein [Actinoplanes rishiriensis]
MLTADEYRSLRPSGRPVGRVGLPAGPARDLRDTIYHLYALADCPRLDALADVIAMDSSLPGAPRKDGIGQIVAGDGLASQQDTVTVAVALARAAGHQDTFALAEKVRDLWVAARTAPPPAESPRLGKPIKECDPLELEVHRVITLPGQQPILPELPPYLRRAHDAQLDELAVGVATGASRMITLVGGSSTGKTRACWELVHRLETRQPGRWRVWHPFDPTRPEAAAAEIERVGPDTIVWLNEAQLYLSPPDTRLGERIAAGLRTLLHDLGRRPVLILATLWPEHWNTLTVRPGRDQPDVHAQARDVLTGTDLDVPTSFTAADLAALRRSDDARLRQAAEHSDDGRVTQYLAGAPELLQRYHKAPPAARAILDAAIDARRLGHPPALPHSLLEQAAPGYLDDSEWDALTDNWLEQALAYTAQSCKGARGPLTRIRPRSGQNVGQPAYRLADYLEETGRTSRACCFPPATFWQASATTITDPGTLRVLATAAHHRGRYRRAVALLRQAAQRGDTYALRELVCFHHEAGDHDGAVAAARRAAELGDTTALWHLAMLRLAKADYDGAASLYREAGDHGDIDAQRELARLWERTGGFDNAGVTVRRAGDHSDNNLSDHARRDGQAPRRHDRITALWKLARLRDRNNDHHRAAQAARQAADHGDTTTFRKLARLREQAGDHERAAALYREAAEHADITALWELAWFSEHAGNHTEALTAAHEAAHHGDTTALRDLAQLRHRAGDHHGAEARYRQAVNHGDPSALQALAWLNSQTGDNRIRRYGLTDDGQPATSLD